MSAADAPPLYSVLPFAAMLLAIAVCPLWVNHWWERNGNKLVLSLLLSAPVVAYYLVRHPYELVATAEEFTSFILLLASLFVISGGIRVTGDLEATPLTNTHLPPPPSIPPPPLLLPPSS